MMHVPFDTETEFCEVPHLEKVPVELRYFAMPYLCRRPEAFSV